ncbi:MAG TPA: exodeoxyribonuclease VII large subunit [Candidatus Binatia bacterium]
MIKNADLPLFAQLERQFLTVSDVNELIKGTLESRLDNMWVVGEISNYRLFPSGHRYFTLKDDKSQIAAVLFRQQGQVLPFTPENGMEVLCFGRITLYPARGDLQFYVKRMEPRGQGALFLAFEQLKRKLAAEGLFAPERKKPLPFLPASIGIVTSERGAALRDMLKIIRSRFPDRRVIVRPVKVQGAGAAREIASGIRDLNLNGDVDVMIVGRGGGSLEDLWSFNEEIVARAIFASKIPVISAVGHEIDFTIADFVADLRAPTPTAAAEMVVPRKLDLTARIAILENALIDAMQRNLESGRTDVSRLIKRLTDPGRKLREHQQRLDELQLRLLRCIDERLRHFKQRLATESGRLSALSPLSILDRGYSIAHRVQDDKIVKDSEALAIGESLRITFARGKAVCRVEGKE